MTARRRVPMPVGFRGSWFAEVDLRDEDEGRQYLPCVHKHWLKGVSYDDPWVQPGVAPWPTFLFEIKSGGRVILTDDDLLTPDGGKKGGPVFNRRGYIAGYAVDDVRVEPDAEGRHHLRFRLVRRLMDFG